jgi:hypothetical protein
MAIKDRIQDDMKAAMRAKDKERLGAIRLIVAAIKQREIDERITLDDAQTIGLLERMLKQRRESISQFEKAGREDLVAKESFEARVIQAYMPTPLSDAEIDAIVARAVADSGAQSIRDMGKVMGRVKAQVQGRADMGAVSALVKARLAG